MCVWVCVCVYMCICMSVLLVQWTAFRWSALLVGRHPTHWYWSCWPHLSLFENICYLSSNYNFPRTGDCTQGLPRAICTQFLLTKSLLLFSQSLCYPEAFKPLTVSPQGKPWAWLVEGSPASLTVAPFMCLHLHGLPVSYCIYSWDFLDAPLSQPGLQLFSLCTLPLA